MRRILLLASVFLVLLALYIWNQQNGTESVAAPLTAESTVVVEPEVEPDADLTALVESNDPARELLQPHGASVSVEERPSCIVVGRALDELGAPLENVPVRLLAYKVWAEGIELPRMEGPYDFRGFEVQTDASGAFRFETPLPTAVRTWLEITPDRYHDSHRVAFNFDGSNSEPALTEGLRDLGEIRLASTGALRGSVVDTHGQPLAGVTIRIGPNQSTTFSRDTRSKEDGSFLVAHAPIGTYTISAKAEGYLSRYIEPVTVEVARDTQVAGFVLMDAPLIQGIVHDQEGQPLDGVRLWGWPTSDGAGAGAKSDSEGRFTIYLPQDEAYTLSAKLDGFLTWGDDTSKSITYAPGTSDLKIVMQALARTQFAVVDAESGESIESFGLSILEDNGSKSGANVSTERRRPPAKEHPGGIARATAREGIDMYLVSAEGYPAATGDVAHDSPELPLQTIRLHRGATLRGRVVRDGVPIAGTQVQIIEIWESTDWEADSSGAKKMFHVRRNTLLSTVTDTEGRFEISGLALAQYQLTATPSAGAPLVVRPLDVELRDVQDLGDLYLLPAAAIVGNVLLPAGIEPAGLQVRVDDWREGASALTDGHGNFRFDNLPAGAHTLLLAGRPGELASSKAVAVELIAGDTYAITLDARDRALCSVRLTIDLGELPVTGRRVSLVSEDYSHYDLLGKCDEHGVVSGSVLAWGTASVRVSLTDSHEVVHPEVLLKLEPRGSVTQDVRFEFASIALQLPSSLALPTEGTARLLLKPATPGSRATSLKLNFQDIEASTATNAIDRVEGNRLCFGALTPGTYSLTLSLTEPYVGFGKAPYYLAEERVTLVANEELSLLLK